MWWIKLPIGCLIISGNAPNSSCFFWCWITPLFFCSVVPFRSQSVKPAPSIQGDDDFPGPTQMWGGLELKLLTLGIWCYSSPASCGHMWCVRFVILCLNLRFVVFGMFWKRVEYLKHWLEQTLIFVAGTSFFIWAWQALLNAMPTVETGLKKHR